jgi:hypothetical protein
VGSRVEGETCACGDTSLGTSPENSLAAGTCHVNLAFKAHRLVFHSTLGLVFEAHRLVHHSALGSRVIKKKRDCSHASTPPELYRREGGVPSSRTSSALLLSSIEFSDTEVYEP